MPYVHSINEDFFTNITKYSAYVLGWIYSDGTLRNNRNQFKISSNDYEVLVLIRKLMLSDHSINSYLRRERVFVNYSLVIDSKKMYKDLVSIGLTPNKSKSMRLPNIHKHLRFFLRGYFEGDGSVWVESIVNKMHTKNYHRLRVSFTSGSKLFLDDIRKMLYDILQLKMHAIRPNHSGFSLEYSTQESIKFLDFIYSDDQSISLERKLMIYKRFLQGIFV